LVYLNRFGNDIAATFFFRLAVWFSRAESRYTDWKSSTRIAQYASTVRSNFPCLVGLRLAGIRIVRKKQPLNFVKILLLYYLETLHKRGFYDRLVFRLGVKQKVARINAAFKQSA
jgi:hypothetical protein